MKQLVAELDKISKYIENFHEPWAIHVVWRLDKVAQLLEEKNKDVSIRFSHISNNILNQYIDKISFLNENQPKLNKIIKEQETKNANAIYSVMKKHFGDLDKKDSIDYIKNVLKNIKK